jgi:exonuclease III
MTKVITINVGGSAHVDNVAKLEEFLDSNKDADIIMLQEYTFKDDDIFFRRGYSVEACEGPLRFAARFGWLCREVFYDDYVQACEFRPLGGRYKTLIVNVHIPTSNSRTKSQVQGLTNLDYCLSELQTKYRKTPVVVGGDFNIICNETEANPTMYSKYYSKDHFVRGTDYLNEIVNEYKLKDSYNGTLYSTKGGGDSEKYGGGARIDKLFVMNLRNYRCDINSTDVGSQHRPVVLCY